MYFMIVNQMKPDVSSEDVHTVIPQHVQWLRARIADGIVVQAGKWGNTGGMAIIKAGSAEEAEGIIQDDPIIKANFVTYVIAELQPAVEIK